MIRNKNIILPYIIKNNQQKFINVLIIFGLKYIG